jgi:hypothetical protein
MPLLQKKSLEIPMKKNEPFLILRTKRLISQLIFCRIKGRCLMAPRKSLLTYTSFGILFALLIIPLFLTSSGAPQSNPTSIYSQPQSAQGSNEDIFIDKLVRSYEISDQGLVTITDEYRILNNKTSTLFYIDICLTNEEYERAIFMKANNQNNGQMGINKIEQKVNGFRVVQVHFDQPLGPYTYFNLTTTIVLKSMLTLELANYFYTIRAQIMPVSPYEMKQYSTLLRLPTGSTQITFNGTSQGGELTHTYTGNDIEPFRNASVNIQYQNTQSPNVVVTQATRTITASPWGQVEVIEEHFVECRGAPAASLNFRIPSDVKNYSAMDDMGSIEGLTLNSKANKDGSANLTLSLTTNRAYLRHGNVMYYKIWYLMQFNKTLMTDMWKYNLRLDLYTLKTDMLIEQQKIELKLLGAHKILDTNMVADKTLKNNEATEFQWWATDVSIFNVKNVDVSYTINVFNLISRGIFYMVLIASIFTIYVVYRTRIQATKPDEEVANISIPIREIRQFVSLYEEKNALQIDIERYDEELIHRRIQKKAHSKAIKVLEVKIKELNEEILPFKTILLDSDDRIQNHIQKLDYLEAEKMSIKDSIQLLEERYKHGKLPSKAAYERLSQELLDRISKTQATIDKNINELRAYLV